MTAEQKHAWEERRNISSRRWCCSPRNWQWINWWKLHEISIEEQRRMVTRNISNSAELLIRSGNLLFISKAFCVQIRLEAHRRERWSTRRRRKNCLRKHKDEKWWKCNEGNNECQSERLQSEAASELRFLMECHVKQNSLRSVWWIEAQRLFTQLLQHSFRYRKKETNAWLSPLISFYFFSGSNHSVYEVDALRKSWKTIFWSENYAELGSVAWNGGFIRPHELTRRPLKCDRFSAPNLNPSQISSAGTAATFQGFC